MLVRKLDVVSVQEAVGQTQRPNGAQADLLTLVCHCCRQGKRRRRRCLQERP
jgi:hypothetical protein